MHGTRACARAQLSRPAVITLGENPSQRLQLRVIEGTIMDLESVFNSAVTGEKQGNSVWQAEIALRLSKIAHWLAS